MIINLRKLKTKLSIIYWLEFMCIPLVPLAFFLFGYPQSLKIATNSYISILLHSFIVFQGGLFWMYQSKKLVKAENKSMVILFQFLKVFNLCLITLTPIYFVFNPFLNFIDTYCSYFFYLFSIIEYIHYYEYQLLYLSVKELNFVYTRGQLKKSRIKRWIAYSSKEI